MYEIIPHQVFLTEYQILYFYVYYWTIFVYSYNIFQVRLRNFKLRNLDQSIMQKQYSDQPVYNPPFHLQKIYNYQKAIYERKGHWTQKEKVKYGVFLQVFKDKFQDKENPILNKMFRVMSDFIKTRNHNQCRSHHQKMEREKFEVDSILDSIKSKYHPRQYELFLQKYTKHIKTLNIEVVLQQKGFTPHKNVENRKKRIEKNKVETQCKRETQKQVSEGQIIRVNRVESMEQQMIHYQQQEKSQIQIIKDCKKQILVKINSFNEQKIGEILAVEEKQKNVEKQVQLNVDQLKIKQQQKTGLQYDQDENQSENVNVAFVQIPSQLQMEGQLNKNTMGLKIFPGIGPQRPLFQFMPSFQGPFNQNYCMPPSSLEQNYLLQIKQLQEQKQWHLNEANRLYTEMNDQIQRANLCEQSKQIIIKSLAQVKRGYYFPNSFINQF